MSGLEIVSGVSAVAGLLGQVYGIWQKVKQDQDIDEKFEETVGEIPTLQSLIEKCHEHLKKGVNKLNKNELENIALVVRTCNDQAEKLKDIFNKFVTQEGDSRKERLVKWFGRLGKGGQVQDHIATIGRQALVLASYDIVRSSDPNLEFKLNEIVQHMEAGKTAGGGTTNYISGGFVHQGTGDINSYGSGNSGTLTMNFGGKGN